MRVIAGKYKGIKLSFISGDDVTRPTTDKVKESLFNILQFDVEGTEFLDLFGGTGQIGIEAASRGAKNVYIVESRPVNVVTIKKNVSRIHKISENTSNIHVFQASAKNFLNFFEGSFDVAFLDPPYKSEILNNLLPEVCEKMNRNGIIITETSTSEKILENIDRFSLQKKYKYGNISLNLYGFENFEKG